MDVRAQYGRGPQFVFSSVSFAPRSSLGNAGSAMLVPLQLADAFRAYPIRLVFISAI